MRSIIHKEMVRLRDGKTNHVNVKNKLLHLYSVSSRNSFLYGFSFGVAVSLLYAYVLSMIM